MILLEYSFALKLLPKIQFLFELYEKKKYYKQSQQVKVKYDYVPEIEKKL